MNTVHLTISRDYVSTWSIWESARELVQNALDTSEYSVEYDRETGTMTIVSKGGILDKKNLLLGISSKRDDDSTIGTYGEGFKLALLVLLRESKQVIIHNGNDLWTPAFDDHPSIKTECLAVTIEENVIPDNTDCVKFIVTGLSESEIDEIQEKTLYDFDTDLIEASYKGSTCWRNTGVSKLFVGGLYVCDIKDYVMSYNFAPNILKLDRDRQSVNGFYLSLEATKLIALSGNYDLLAELADKKSEDISDYFTMGSYGYGGYSETANDELKEVVSASFISKHGEKAYPINADAEEKEKRVQTVKAIDSGLIPVVVKTGYYNMLTTAVKDKDVTKFKAFNVSKEILAFYEENKSQLRGKPKRALDKLVQLIQLHEGIIELPPTVKSKLVVDQYESDTKKTKPVAVRSIAPPPAPKPVIDKFIDDIPF